MKRILIKSLTLGFIVTFGGTALSQWKNNELTLHSSLFRQPKYLLFLMPVEYPVLTAGDDTTFQERSSKFVIVLKETGYGTLLGIGLSLPGALLGGLIGSSTGDWWSGFGGFSMGAYTGFVVGSSLGVYCIAKEYNPNLSYWGTLGSGIVGGGIGLGLNLAAQHKGAARIAPIIFPIIASIIYVEIID